MIAIARSYRGVHYENKGVSKNHAYASYMLKYMYVVCILNILAWSGKFRLSFSKSAYGVRILLLTVYTHVFVIAFWNSYIAESLVFIVNMQYVIISVVWCFFLQILPFLSIVTVAIFCLLIAHCILWIHIQYKWFLFWSTYN